MAKWPNVPHCYGWLALDARGVWRMRDDRAQALSLPGDPIRNAALVAFINRNYLHDEQGRWYFQNGPQRVYVNLEATPYIARTDPAQGFVLHTGEALETLDAAWLTDDGQMVLKSAEKLTMVDDRDMAQCLSHLRIDGREAGDDEIMLWLDGLHTIRLGLHWRGRTLPVERLARASLPERFGFNPQPRP